MSFSIWFVVLLLPAILAAQDTRGTISGSVTDAQGATVAGHRDRDEVDDEPEWLL